jgi:hypothetical protein
MGDDFWHTQQTSFGSKVSYEINPRLLRSAEVLRGQHSVPG